MHAVKASEEMVSLACQVVKSDNWLKEEGENAKNKNSLVIIFVVQSMIEEFNISAH